MKKFTNLTAAAVLLAALFFSVNADAQMAPVSPLRFGIGLEGGVPTGYGHDLSKYEIGGTLRLQYDFSQKFALMVTSGYYSFMVKNTNAATTTFGTSTYSTSPHDLGMIPVKLGAKDFVSKNLYFDIEGGAGFETKYDTDVKTIVSAGIGYATKSIDVGLRYEDFSGQNNSYGLVGLRIAYGFAL